MPGPVFTQSYNNLPESFFRAVDVLSRLHHAGCDKAMCCLRWSINFNRAIVNHMFAQNKKTSVHGIMLLVYPATVTYLS